MKRKVICYGIGIPLTIWFGFDIIRVAVLWIIGTLVPLYSVTYIGVRLPLLVIGILLIWVARKKIKLKTREVKAEG